MKLEAIRIGLTTALACALGLSGCDTGSGDEGPAEGTDGDDDDDDTEGDDTEGDDDDDADDTEGDDDDDSGPTMGMDSPTFDCDGASGTLTKYFTVSDMFDDTAELDGIAIIDGNVDISNSPYNSLDFLECVTEIRGNVTIFGNQFLEDVSGTHNIEVLLGDLIITQNPVIRNVDGFDKLVELPRTPNPAYPPDLPEEFFHSLLINKNDSLEEINGFGALQFIFGNLNVSNNAELKHIDGLAGILGIGANLSIKENPNLCESSINTMGSMIVSPPPDQIPDTWVVAGNDPGC